MEEPRKPLQIQVATTPTPPEEAQRIHEAYKEMVYHYTGAAALLSIVTKRTLWMTSTQFVNDVYEFQQPTRRLLQMLQDRGPTSWAHSVTPRHLQAFALHLNNNMGTYVTSFSQAGNALSQFRLYGQGAGYSIGFQRSYLTRLAAQLSTGTRPSTGAAGIVDCNYSSEELGNWCRAYAADFFQAAAGFDDGKMSPQEIWDGIYGHTDLFDRRLMAQMTFKSHEFEVEKEVRLYKFGFPVKQQSWRISRGGNYVVPYVEIDLPNEPVIAPLSAGPNLDGALAHASCAALIQAGLKAETVWKFALSGGVESGFRVGL